ncbi:MAG: hypothetical protein AAF218_09835 [Pseudomonadota bacterium]
MNTDVARLLGLHHLASAFGQGLKPDLLRLLMRYKTPGTPGVVPLNAVPKSAGPAPAATPAQLAAAGIPMIAAAPRQDAADG